MFKLIVFTLVFFYSNSVFSQTIYYQLSSIKNTGEKNSICIQMKFQADISGITKLSLPNKWTDADNLFESIVDLKVENVLSTKIKIIDGTVPYEKYILSRPNANIQLSYNLINNNYHVFKPTIKEKYFSFIGTTAFILVDNQNSEKPNSVILEWDIPIKKKYSIINTFGINQKIQKIESKDLLEAVFLGGDINLITFGTDNQLAFAYTEPSELYTAWQKDAIDLINAQRAAMKNEAIPYYLVSMIKTDIPGNDFSAAHLKNSAIFVHGENFLNIPRKELIRYTTHEFFHYWVGVKVKASKDYINAMWFFEGFNDYLSIEIAHDAKLLNDQDYVSIKNRIFDIHYRSPFQIIKNRELALYYWDNPELHAVPYIKGHLFAQYCDNLLKKENKNLADIILLMSHDNNKYYKNQYTENDIIKILSELISEDIYETYAHNILNGAHFKKNIDISIKDYKFFYIEKKLPKYEIDLIQTFLDNRVFKLNKKGTAYNDGLREGYLVDYLSVDPFLKNEGIELGFFNKYNYHQKITLNPTYYQAKVPFLKHSGKIISGSLTRKK